MLIGIGYISNLAYSIMINSGSFDTLIESVKTTGTDVSQLEYIKDIMISTKTSSFYLAGYERILTMILHLALTLIVCYFVYKKKDIIGIGICLLVHSLIDFIAPLCSAMSTDIFDNMLTGTQSNIIIYTFLNALFYIQVL